MSCLDDRIKSKKGPHQLLNDAYQAEVKKYEAEPLEPGPVTYPIKYVTGRPTKYRPEFCDKLIEWGYEGKSRAYICSQLAISKDTLYKWIRDIESFAYAYRLSQDLAQEWWESTAKGLLVEKSGGDKLNNTLYTFHMRNRFKEDYTESNQVVTLTQKLHEEKLNSDVVDRLDEIEKRIRNGNGHKQKE